MLSKYYLFDIKYYNIFKVIIRREKKMKKLFFQINFSTFLTDGASFETRDI